MKDQYATQFDFVLQVAGNEDGVTAFQMDIKVFN